MRLLPIEKPKGILTKIMYFMMKRSFGKVITPMKVIYARNPSLAFVVKKMQDTEENKLKIATETKLLVKNRIADLNGCAFCVDISEHFAEKSGLSIEKFRSVYKYETSDLFSDADKAVLNFVTEIIKNGEASDQAWNEIKKYFTERQIVDICYVSAVESYYNVFNKALEIHSDNLCSI